MSIWDEIQAERTSQDLKHGGIPNDDRNTLTDWKKWITRHLNKASMPNFPYGPRYALIRVAALAVAAVEAYDRNNGFPEQSIKIIGYRK